MIQTNQLERLAAMGNALRPDWPKQSLYTFLTKHTDRAYRDLAVALAYVAADPATDTPARLSQDGPWWHATRDPNAAPAVRPIVCPECGGIHTLAEGHKRHEPEPDETPQRERNARGLQALRQLHAEAKANLCRHGIRADTCRECRAKAREAEARAKRQAQAEAEQQAEAATKETG